MTRKRTPTEDTTTTETGTATIEPPAADAPPAEGGEAPASFAQRVGEKIYKPTPDPFGIATDYAAGVRLFESRKDRQMALMFGDGRSEDKPSQAVIDTVKAAGYRWNPVDRIWSHPVYFESAMQTRIEAERLYEEVRQMIRQEKGIDKGGPEQGVPF